jgi:hypothetical protein
MGRISEIHVFGVTWFFDESGEFAELLQFKKGQKSKAQIFLRLSQTNIIRKIPNFN